MNNRSIQSSRRKRIAVWGAAALALAAATIAVPLPQAAAQAPTCDGKVVTINLNTNGGSGDGTAFDDVILGTPGRDTINAGGGNDTICSGGGRDSVDGGAGDDLIFGGGGHDVLRGGSGADTIYGQPGADNIRGEGGEDTLLGGTGYDTLDGGDNDDFIQGSGGNDTLRGGNGNDSLYGKAGNDVMFGEGGNDELYAAGGNDVVSGGPGRDRLQGANGDDQLDGGLGDDSLYGQAGNDELIGGDGNDEIYGAAGNDDMSGGDGNDRLQGANGDDVLAGGAGNDIMFGQAGSDELDGGAGTDECYAAELERNCEPIIPPLAGQVVRITGPERSAEEWDAIDAALVPFEQATGVSVIYTGAADWEAELNVQVAAGNAPDISIFPQPAKLADFARSGVVVPLGDDALSTAASNWTADQLNFGFVDSDYFGMPVRSDPKSIVWFKPSVFAANGWAIPQTWNELVALTNTMIANGVTPWCVGIESGQATGWVFTDWAEDRILGKLGADAYDAWVANDLKFNSPEIRGAFQDVLSLWNTPGAVFGSTASISTTHFAIGPAEGLAADNCAMVRQASFFHLFYDGDVSELDVFAFPSGTSATTPIVGGAHLAGAFNDRTATMAVLEYMGSAQYANTRQIAQRASRGGGISGFYTANLNVNRSLWSPLGQSLVTILQGSDPFRFDGSDLMPASVGAGAFWTQSTAMVNGTASVSGATAAIDAAWPNG